MGDVLVGDFAEFFRAVAGYFAKLLVGAQPVTVGGNVSDPDGSLLEGGTETLFAFAQCSLKRGRALQDFVHVQMSLTFLEIGKKRLVATDSFYRGLQTCTNRRFDQIAAGAGAVRLANHFGRFVLAENQDLGLGKGITNEARGLEAVEVRHADVHDDDIWFKLLGLSDGVPAVNGIAANVEVLRLRKKRAYTTAHNFMVVRNENA